MLLVFKKLINQILRRNSYWYLFILIFNLTAQPVAANPIFGKIEGFVVSPDGNPIPHLLVMLVNTDYGDITDEKGYYLIENIPPDKYDVKFEHISFKPKTIREVVVLKNQVVHLDMIGLEYNVLKLKGDIITDTRADYHIVTEPKQTNIVSDHRIREQNAKTSAEVLREETGIFVQKTSHGGGSAIIRGLSSNRILILVDGIRLNNSIYRLGNHPYLTTIDFANIQRLEIMRGPTSSLYGSDALGGTINVITKKPSPVGNGYDLDYRLMTRLSSADKEKMIRSAVALHKNNMAFKTGISYKDYDDLERGGNSHSPQLEGSTNGLKQSPSGFSAYDLDSKFVYNLSPFQSLIFAYQGSNKIDVPRYDKYENNGYHRWIYTPQRRDLVYLKYESQIPKSFLTALRTSLSYHRQDEGREIQKKVTDTLTKERDVVGTIGFSLQLNSSLQKHLFTFGTDLYLDDVASERYFLETESDSRMYDERGRYPNGSKYNSLGLYVQDEFSLTKSWFATSGIRLSLISTHFTLPPDTIAGIDFGELRPSYKSLVGNLGLTHIIDENMSISANLGQAFRAPNLSDISKFGESKGNTYEVPNTDLLPEKMLSFDLGMKVSHDRIKAGGCIYYARINNLIASAEATYNGTSTIERGSSVFIVKSKQNIGNAFIRGLEASLDVALFDRLTLHANVTKTYGQTTSMSEPMGKIPPTFGLLEMKWMINPAYINTYIRFAAGQNRLSSDDKDDPRIPEGGTPAWYTWNMRIGYQLWNRFMVRGAIENILNVNYREHGSGINGPGRNFIISVEI